MTKKELGEMRSRLLKILRKNSYERREVILASGEKSDFYIDCRQTTLHPEGAYLIGCILYEIAEDIKAEGVGGLTMGADPVVSAVSITSYMRGNPIPAFVIRKAPKQHGLGLWIEGKKNIREGAGVMIVEDVVTTGGSSINAARKAEEGGLRVIAIVSVVDRGEGAAENIKKEGYVFRSLFTKLEITEG